MIKNTTLKNQIAMCILFSLPIPVMLHATVHSGLALLVIFSYLLNPIIVFWVLFGTMEIGKDCKFKGLRIFIATVLWSVLWYIWMFVNSKYMLDFARWINKNYGIETIVVIYASGSPIVHAIVNSIAIAVAVILSYVIGKWINSKLPKKT